MSYDSEEAKQFAEDVIKFSFNYLTLHPNETQPTIELVDRLLSLEGVNVFLSPMNLIMYQKIDDGYEFIAHWCCASEKLKSSQNMTAFFEVLRLVKSLGFVKIFGLNSKYDKATIDIGEGYRIFK